VCVCVIPFKVQEALRWDTSKDLLHSESQSTRVVHCISSSMHASSKQAAAHGEVLQCNSYII
jgi:hypothetical protein